MWQCIECELENPKTLDTCQKCGTPRPTETLIGEQISQWVIESELGEGGMAVVFQARHVMLGSPVAIKVLRADLMHKREVVERFRTEALAASHLRHDNVIQVHDFGTQKGVGVYMVLEFLEGMDLEDKLNDAPLPVPWIMSIAKQICSGLEAAHNAGIIHRDLKPSNIYLVPRKDTDIPLVKILDFGIAKIQESQLFEGQQNLTRTGTVLGTPYYLSPEQLRRREKQELGASVDIYAFGVILYQLLTGHLPIEEPTLAEQMAAILTKTPPTIGAHRPELAGTSLELLMQRLLSKQPKDRPSTIAEVWEELQKAAGAFQDPEIDAALRQQWKDTYKTPELADIARPPSFFARYGVTFALIFMLLGGGSLLGYTLLKTPTQPTERRRPSPLPPERLPQWADLQNRGTRAYRAGNYLEAIKLWKQSLSKLNKNPSSTNPNDQIQLRTQRRKLFEAMSTAALKSNRNFAALRFLQQQLASTPDLSEKDKQDLQNRIRDLQQGLSKDREAVKLLDEVLANSIKSKAYDNAHKVYQRLREFNDKSLPDPIISAANGIQNILPSMALKLFDQALKLDMDDKTLKQVNDKKSALNKQVQSRRKEFTTLLNQSRINLKTLFKELEKQPADPALHRALLRRIQQLLPTQTNTASKLLRAYGQFLRQLPRKPSWLWLKPLLGKQLPTSEQIKQLLALTRNEKRTLREATAFQKTEERHLKRGHMDKMLETSLKKQTQLEQFWKKVASVGGPFQATAQKRLEAIQAQKEKIQKLTGLWTKITQNHEQDQLSQSSSDYQTLSTLIQNDSSKKGFEKTYKKWQDLHAKAQKYLQLGEQSAKRQRWSSCQSRFDQYLRLYPKSSNKEVVKLKRCKCRCKLPAPFEPCSEQCKLPY